MVVVSLAGYAGVTVVVVVVVARGGGGVERTETQLYSKGDANRTAIRFGRVTSFGGVLDMVMTVRKLLIL